MTESPGGVPGVDSEAAGLIHALPALSTLTLAASNRIVLQKVYGSFVLLKAISQDIPLQRISNKLLFLHGRHDLLVVQGNRGFLDVQ